MSFMKLAAAVCASAAFILSTANAALVQLSATGVEVTDGYGGTVIPDGRTFTLTAVFDTDATPLESLTNYTRFDTGLVSLVLNVDGTIFTFASATDTYNMVQNIPPGATAGADATDFNITIFSPNATDLDPAADRVSINLSSRAGGSFGSQSNDFIADLLFSDPDNLFENVLLQTIVRSNFVDGPDGGFFPLSTGIVYGNARFTFDAISFAAYEGTADPVPLPAAAWLFAPALGGLIAARRKRKAA